MSNLDRMPFTVDELQITLDGVESDIIKSGLQCLYFL